jgi:hypothetical protein
MLNFSSRWMFAVLAGSVALGLAGCAAKRDKLAYDNFTQIRTGVHNRDDVEAILGEPDQRLDDRFLYQRPDKHLHVFVEFDDKGRVSRTQWIDAMDESNLWHDSDDAKPHRTPGGH